MQNNIKTNYELYDAEDTGITDTEEIGGINLPKIPGVKLIPETLPYEIKEKEKVLKFLRRIYKFLMVLK